MTLTESSPTPQAANGDRSPDVGTDLRVRAATADDAEQLHAILDSPHVLDGTMRIPHSTVESTWESLRPNTDQRLLVAVDRSDRVVGLLVLVTHLGAPRFHHVAHIDLVATHPAHQGRGAAGLLINTVIEMAEQWMAIERLELIVFTGNVGAARLYERLGFRVEGTMEHYGFARGRYVDAHVMARLTSRPAAR
ncbi:MAG: GNAT family N-acetyltransferase [Ilumatobacter sp.]|nr:GNAT family N-acetyltransferase [Ilumatobacter sp.]